MIKIEILNKCVNFNPDQVAAIALMFMLAEIPRCNIFVTGQGFYWGAKYNFN